MFTTLQNEKLKHKEVIFQYFDVTIETIFAAANKTNGVPALVELTHAAHTHNEWVNVLMSRCHEQGFERTYNSCGATVRSIIPLTQPTVLTGNVRW